MASDLLTRAEQNRATALAGLDPKSQDSLGQFFTPARAAVLLASMPQLPDAGQIRVLDPGAGSGMLSAALVARVLNDRSNLAVHVVAVERDETLLPQLRDTLDACATAGSGRVTYELVTDDFITASTGTRPDERLGGFDLVIQNPPYGKLAASAPARAAVRETQGDAPNLYAAFLALGAAALRPNGQLVAITPRSFCNGPYFGAFRAYLLRQISLDRVHIFESRSTVFADTGVLQENVIFSGTRGGGRDTVLLSASNGHEDKSTERRVRYSEVVHASDPHQFIRIASKDEDTEVAERMLSLPDTLASLGITASPGRVVDFRSRDSLLYQAVTEAAPLVYPGNLRQGLVTWPRELRKPQWFRPASERDAKLLLPEGWYCVIKRFSAKEERRRIVAAVWSPDQTPGPVAFENHLNVLHLNGTGLDREIAFGLSMWLNSSLVEKFFRSFSGHTQVNATDLRTMRFPDAGSLHHLGLVSPHPLSGQEEIDMTVEKVISKIDVVA